MLRCLKYLGIVCLVSFVANYAVAWIGALCYVQRPIALMDDSRGWHYNVNTDRIRTVVFAVAVNFVGADASDDRGSAPRWSVLQRSPTSAEWAAVKWRWEEAYGWPFRSVMSSQVMTKQLQDRYVWTARHAVVVPSGRNNRRALDVRAALPLEPIVIGFAANTLVYAPAVLLVMLFAGMGHRFVRTRRGRCARCGYQLMGDVERCPECGHRSASGAQ